jgi:drug/metabolite transporter (DMT)-like permease
MSLTLVHMHTWIVSFEHHTTAWGVVTLVICGFILGCATVIGGRINEGRIGALFAGLCGACGLVGGSMIMMGTVMTFSTSALALCWASALLLISLAGTVVYVSFDKMYVQAAGRRSANKTPI